MPLIKDGKIIEDSWQMLADEQDLQQSGDVIFPLARLNAFHNLMPEHQGKLGLEVPNTVDPFDLKDVVEQFDLILLELPSFTDGRAYSQARVLRQDLGFKGELRIKGDVLPDQASFLTSLGFDSFDIDSSFDEEVWARALSAITHSYQYGYPDSARHRSQNPA